LSAVVVVVATPNLLLNKYYKNKQMRDAAS
jgi:predicted permease